MKVMKGKSAKEYLDDVAAALHPHWSEGSRNGYAPGRLANMVKALQMRLAIAEKAVAHCRTEEHNLDGYCSDCLSISKEYERVMIAAARLEVEEKTS